MFVDFNLSTFSESRAELEQSNMAREQVAVELEQGRDARCESEESRKVNVKDLAKLTRAIGIVMIGLYVPFAPMLLDRLLKEVRRLPEVIRERELSTARRAVHRVLAMFESHYQGLDCTTLSGGWAPSISDTQCDKLEEDCTAFARDMPATALKDPDLRPGDAPKDPESFRPSS
jgi:hypothetical protein